MSLRCSHTSIFIETLWLEGLPTKAKEDSFPSQMRLSPTGHQPSIIITIVINIIIAIIIIIIIIITTISYITIILFNVNNIFIIFIVARTFCQEQFTALVR